MGTLSLEDEAYFLWLYRRVALTSGNEWDRLLLKMFETEFIWLVSNDGSRLQDGLDLRDEYVDETNAEPTQAWWDIPCSFLEMLIALAGRLDFQTDVGRQKAFWELVSNLGLSKYTNPRWTPRVSKADEEVTEILERAIFRTYDYNGAGGIFPLMEPRVDSRRRELWFQMMDYIRENHPT